MTTIITPPKQKLIDFSKPFLCSVEGYDPMPTNEIFDIVDEKKHIVNTRLAHCNRISRNRCFYGLNDVLWALKNSKYVQECVAQGIWFGELEHPVRGSKLDRFMRIDDDRISHKIHKYWAEGDFLKGRVQFIPPYGDMVWRWITEADVNMAFSLRIYTPNYIKKKDGDGVPYVEKTTPMFPVTFDAVKTPGYQEVRICDPNTFASKNEAYLSNGRSDMGVESALYSLSWEDDDPKNSFKKLLESTSQEDLNIIGDLFDMDMKKCKVFLNSDEYTVTYGAEDGREVTMNLNAYLFNQVMNKGAL